MALEQVLSDRDSEDEVDDDVADFEDRRVMFYNLTSLAYLRLTGSWDAYAASLPYSFPFSQEAYIYQTTELRRKIVVI